MSDSVASARPVAVLGSTGLGMALSLLRAGFAVTGYDPAPASAGRVAASPDEAAGADVAVSVVVNADQTDAVLFGEVGCATALADNGVFVSYATMAPGGWRPPAATTWTRP